MKGENSGEIFNMYSINLRKTVHYEQYEQKK